MSEEAARASVSAVTFASSATNDNFPQHAANNDENSTDAHADDVNRLLKCLEVELRLEYSTKPQSPLKSRTQLPQMMVETISLQVKTLAATITGGLRMVWVTRRI